MSNPTKHLWHAEDYHQHSSVQNAAAEQVLQSIQFKGNEKILDVGCGDGKITARTAKRVPAGYVIGIDISQQMIDFACKSFPKEHHPNLTFLVQDAQHFNYSEELDLVFSSFALQWLPDPSSFFKCANNSLKSSGHLAATIPLGISSELEEAINITISLPEWFRYFKEFSPRWHFIPADNYKHLLIENHFTPEQFVVVSQKVIFPSRENFEKYVIQWLPYLNPLPQDLKQVFFQKIIDKYLEIIPSSKNGEVEFKFSKLNFIAKKTSLSF